MARDAIKISKNLDDNSITNRLEVNVSDGTESLLINADGSLNAVVSATDLDIRNLSETQDHVLVFANTAKDGSGTDYVPLVDADGHLQVDILSGAAITQYVEDVAAPAAATGNAMLAERDDALAGITPAEGDWTSLFTNARGALWVELDPTNTVSIDDNGASITVDGTVAISGTVTVTATDLDIRDLTHVSDSVKVGDGTDFLAINTDGSINVVMQSSTGTAIANYDQAAALASAASDNHDYTASGGTFEPTSVSVSGESLGTFTILANAVTIAILRTSVENPNAVYEFPDGFSIADTQVLRVTRTNDSNKAHNFESTINGYQN